MPLVERQVTQVNLQRGLIIGIGGSGAEIIGRLRRMLIDRFGRLEDLPIIRFLYIDTDKGWLAEKETGSAVEKEIPLPESEKVDAQFSDATALYRGIQGMEYPHYSWFTIEKLQDHKTVSNGAGTIRQLGRLCFWNKSQEIRAKMERLLGELNKDDNAKFMVDKYNITIDPGINVHIIAGLAGGTGSGMFLDTAYMARKVMQTLKIAGANQVAGYLVLPGAFGDVGGANALPNGYAALKELNYYNYMYSPDNPLASVYGQSVWDADYTGRETDRVHFVGQAPFDYCYLLDAKNNFVDLHRNEIFAMLARSLFHEFTLSFATFKRSLRANIKHRIVHNDTRDCPTRFMSFGQSAVFIPKKEIEEILQYQLALRAMQQWIDKTASPMEVFGENQELKDADEAEKEAAASITKQADDPKLIDAVRSFIIRELIPGGGLRAKDVLTTIMAEEKERMVDVPLALVEAEKQRWISEQWPFDQFEGMLTDAWRRWKLDFNDEGALPVAWGEKIRRMDANREQAEKEYRRRLHDKIMAMFEDAEKYGPAWAMCVAKQLRPALASLKEQFLKEANDSVAIATVMGDTYLINAAAGGQGPTLSAIIEKRIGEEFKLLDKAVKGIIPIGKRDRIEKAAYEYLSWCARWCRARVEERGRRLVAVLADNLSTALADFERQLLEDAGFLARLRTELLRSAKEWSQKAVSTENIGQLLYNSNLLRAIDVRIRERQGDQYDPMAVAQQALKKMGKGLRELRQDELDQLFRALLEAAQEAIGDLSEERLQDTRFAAHDLLSAQYNNDNELDQTLSKVTQSGSPFVVLESVPDWVISDELFRTSCAGMRGGFIPPGQDQDHERSRIIESLKRIGWDVTNGLQGIDDSSQIVFFQECGGFPLRALAGISDMRLAYEEHRNQGGTPLHIVRDEQAATFPDIIPPKREDLERGLTLQTLGVTLGFISPCNFPDPAGTGQTRVSYCYLKEIPELNEQETLELGPTLESIGLYLAYNPARAAVIEKEIDGKLMAATPEEKAQYAQKLREHLNAVKERLRSQAGNAQPENMPAYVKERSRVLAIMQKYGLVASQ